MWKWTGSQCREARISRTCEDPSSIILNKLKVMEWSLHITSVKGITEMETEKKEMHLCESSKYLLRIETLILEIVLRWKKHDSTIFFNWCRLWILTVLTFLYYYCFLCCSALWLVKHTCCQIRTIIGWCCNTTPPLLSTHLPKPWRRLVGMQMCVSGTACQKRKRMHLGSHQVAEHHNGDSGATRCSSDPWGECKDAVEG